MSELQAGRELDALIAEKVMGWKPADPKLGWGTDRLIWITGHEEESGSPTWQDFNPSTDIAAAWEVVDKLTMTTKQWFRLEMSSTTHEATFETIGAGEDDAEWTAEAETAPLAICLAALKAMGYFRTAQAR